MSFFFALVLTGIISIIGGGILGIILSNILAKRKAKADAAKELARNEMSGRQEYLGDWVFGYLEKLVRDLGDQTIHVRHYHTKDNLYTVHAGRNAPSKVMHGHQRYSDPIVDIYLNLLHEDADKHIRVVFGDPFYTKELCSDNETVAAFIVVVEQEIRKHAKPPEA